MQEDMLLLKSPVKVLVVDDMEENRTLFSLYLRKSPYTLSFAENGEEALKKCEEENFDMILMDIQMPDMDGYETTRKIRALKKDSSKAVIFATTANAFPRDVEESIDAGCNVHLSKPIKRDVLVHMIDAWLKYHFQKN